MAEARHILVSGIVQGVGFRMFTERAARSLGLSGWVRNLDDGRVEIYAEGDPDRIDRLVEQCRVGPRSASVDDLSERVVDATGASDFGARATAYEPADL